MNNKDKIEHPQQQHVKKLSGEISISPIPAPEILEKYEKLHAGTLNRILSMAEKEQNHRHEADDEILSQNRELVESATSLKTLGLLSGFIISLTTIIGAIYLLSIGRTIEGLSTMLGILGSLVGIFIYGKKSDKKNRDSTS